MEEVDRRILAFVGAHRFVLAPQLQRFLGGDIDVASHRLASLEGDRLVRCERLSANGLPLVRITGGGLRAIGSRLPAPGFDLGSCRHELGAVALWIAAWQGSLGKVERVLSGREMAALDRAAPRADAAEGGFAALGDGAYPDVMLVGPGGRVPVHLVLWPDRGGGIGTMLEGYGSDRRVGGVVMCVEDKRTADELQRIAMRVGMAERVRVRMIGLGPAGHIAWSGGSGAGA